MESSKLDKSTIEQQELLARYCRSGEIPNAIEANPERLKHYRRLVYNVINDTLSSAYPIAKSHLGEKEWGVLIASYFKLYPSQEPQVWKMPYGLLEFVTDYPTKIVEEKPFLAELIYFEWLEIELYAEPDLKLESFSSTIKRVNLNPHHRLIQLNYPFHKESVESALTNPKPHYVVLFRNLETFKVEFTEVTLFITQVLESLEENDFQLEHTVTKIASGYNVTDKAVIDTQLKVLFEKLSGLGLFL